MSNGEDQTLWLAALAARGAQAPLRERVPLLWGEHVIGSVEPDYFDQTQLQGAWNLLELLRKEEYLGSAAWRLQGEATTSLAQLAQALRRARVGRVAQQWRNEQLAVCDQQGRVLATVERAIVRALGIATRAVHLVGRSPTGRIWVQQRALDKPNDPGQWDTLMGGMVMASDTVQTALARETLEEAGLALDTLEQLRWRGHLCVQKPASQEADAGYVVEQIDWYDCIVPDTALPVNQDGEVAQFLLLGRTELIERLQRDEFTIEAALILVAALDLS